MPQAIPLIVMAIGTAAKLTAMQMFFAMAAASVVAGMLQKTAGRDNLNAEQQGIKVNTRSTTEPLQPVYGEIPVGGNDVFIESAGPDNRDLWIVTTLADGECQGIAQIDGVDQVKLDDKLYTEYGGNVEYWFVPGNASHDYTSTPGLSHLYAAIPKCTDNYRHTALIIWHFTFNRDYFNSLPSRQVLLQGRVLYDYRDDSTAYSTNHALALYDYMTNARYGMAIAAAKLDTGTTWTGTANYIDTKGWALNHVAPFSMAKDVMDSILLLFRGQIISYADTLYLRYADLNYETSLMTITDEHIVQQEDGRVRLKVSQAGMYGKPDGLTAWFLDPDKDYAADSIQVGEESGVIEEMKLYGSTDRKHVADITVYSLERRQLDRIISGLFRDACQELDPHDVITFNSTSLNISSQLCRVDIAGINPDGLVALSLKYEATTLYDDDYNLDVEGTYTCDLPDKDMAIPTVANVAVSEEVYSTRLRSQTRLKISFDEPAAYPWFSHVEVWVSEDDATYTHQFPTDNDFYIEPVKEGQTIYIRLKTVSIHGRKTTDANDYKISHVVAGQDSAPTSLGSLEAIVNANTINLYAARLEDDDIELYEFRLGSSWSGAIFLAALRSPNLSLVGVKPGNHTFIANTLSTNKEYGDTPRSNTASLIDPPDGWTVQNTETCDYNGVGTHDNTEHLTYASDDYLKCSHTADVLVGTYTSPIYDRGASDRYMVYALADVVITGAGTTWDDQVPGSTTWDQINASTRRWIDIFELAAAPQVQMALLYGESSPPTNRVERQEILSAVVTGRYFQLEITITDPSAEVYALVENFTLKFCQ